MTMNVLNALISFASRWFPYFVVAGVGLFHNCLPSHWPYPSIFHIEFRFHLVSIVVVILVVLYCFLKQLADDAGTEQEQIGCQDATAHETEPILPGKEVFFSYRTTGEQPESSECPAEDSDGDKMCKICYDAPWSCFFIPCGHCFTCFTWARRIVEEGNKACPICRRIHRVKRV